MCTVTYFPGNDGSYIFCHSRDEVASRRSTALVHDRNKNCLYPVDPRGGGSWIAASKRGTAALLNGSRKLHERRPPYRMSRGLILLDFMRYETALAFASDYNLTDVEPFTLVSRLGDGLTELHWDGRLVDLVTLDPQTPKLWASWTLYPATWQQRRQEWFQEWILSHEHPTVQDLEEFHKGAGDGIDAFDLLMKRGEGPSTTSITSVLHIRGTCTMSSLGIEDQQLRTASLT